MSHLDHSRWMPGFGPRPAFGRRISVFGAPLKALLCGLALTLILHPASLRACAACYGQSDSPMAAGMNWGIMSLLAVVVVVLGGISSFFIYLARRAGRAPLLAAAVAAWPPERKAPLLGPVAPRQHLARGSFQPAGRLAHRCAQATFGDSGRQIIPGSTHSIL